MQQPRRRTIVALALFGAMATVAACGSDDPTVASMTVTGGAGTVRSGATLQFNATPMDNDGNPISGKTVTWASGDAAVATVDANGLVTGIGNGTTMITATSDGVSGSAAVTGWIGMTGVWSGDVMSGGAPCPMTMSVTENAAGAITGTGTLNDPADGCIDGTYTVAGTDNTGSVADSVFLAWTGSTGITTPIDMAGTFDGTDGYAGAMGTGCGGCPIDFTRGTVVPTVRASTMAGHEPKQGGGIGIE